MYLSPGQRPGLENAKIYNPPCKGNIQLSLRRRCYAIATPHQGHGPNNAAKKQAPGGGVHDEGIFFAKPCLLKIPLDSRQGKWV